MSVALNLYQRLNQASDEAARNQAIADAFDAMEQRYIAHDSAATKADLRETELRLQKEIEQVRLETRSVEARLLTAIHRQTIWIIGAVGAVVGLVRVLDSLLQ